MIIEYQTVNIYQDDVPVLQGVDFHVEESEFIYIIGPVGSGKSSLLKTLYGELDLYEGRSAWPRHAQNQAQGNTRFAQGDGHHLSGFPTAARP